MEPNLAELIRAHASRGVLVDANLLLLYIVGSYDLQRISRFKRTCQFQPSDFEFLARFMALFHRRVTTPSVLAEVSNLVSQMGEPARTECLASLAADIETLDERYDRSRDVAREESFLSVGLTDAAIQVVARAEGLLVLTDDYRLANRLLAEGLAAINYNHIREFGVGGSA
jgi:rRNA-processing protein FCF1